jgi:hypothetical protein
MNEQITVKIRPPIKTRTKGFGHLDPPSYAIGQIEQLVHRFGRACSNLQWVESHPTGDRVRVLLRSCHMLLGNPCRSLVIEIECEIRLEPRKRIRMAPQRLQPKGFDQSAIRLPKIALGLPNRTWCFDALQRSRSLHQRTRKAHPFGEAVTRHLLEAPFAPSLKLVPFSIAPKPFEHGQWGLAHQRTLQKQREHGSNEQAEGKQLI